MPVTDETNTRVWQAFYDMAKEETPQLRMRPPDNKPRGAAFIYFYDALGLSSPEIKRKVNIVYKHRLTGNYVDIQFGRMSETALQDQVSETLEHDMSVARAAASASIRVQVPAVDFSRIPKGQEDAIRAGLHTAERLRSFFVEHSLVDILDPG